MCYFRNVSARKVSSRKDDIEDFDPLRNEADFTLFEGSVPKFGASNPALDRKNGVNDEENGAAEQEDNGKINVSQK